MTTSIQSLGWFVRRSAHPERLAAFYHEVLRFPVLRSTSECTSLWIGETTVLDIARGGTANPAFADRNQAPCYPIFRVHQFEKLYERIENAGVNFIAGHYSSQLIFLTDPDGNVIGLSEQTLPSSRPVDAIAKRDHELGEPRLPGVDPMPDDIQAIRLLALRSNNFESQWAYYQDVVGLPLAHGPVKSHEDETQEDAPLNTGLLYLGETPLLQISVTPHVEPVPTDPTAVTNSFILRVHDIHTLVSTLESRGVSFLQKPTDVDGGTLAYFVDPKGHLIGLQERHAGSQRPEDIVADRRWAEQSAVPT